MNYLEQNKRIIVLGLALAVITLYIVPIDQILALAQQGGNTKTPPNSSNDKVKDNCDNGNGNHFGHCYKIVKDDKPKKDK